MGDMLSQEEINALLGVIDNDQAPPTEATAEDAPQNEEPVVQTQAPATLAEGLSDEERDILGEIGNISMGTSATTLFALLNQKVQITTPHVDVVSWGELANSYDRPCVGIRVDYKEGLRGSNLLVLKETDVKIIANLMMGGDGTIAAEEPLNEIDLSAIGEAMNQMVGSSATSLSSLIQMKIDIDTPHAFQVNFNDDAVFDNIGFSSDEYIIRVSFRMEIGTLIDSYIMQILPLEFGKEIVNTLKNQSSFGGAEEEVVPSAKEEKPKPKPAEPAPMVEKEIPPQPQEYHQASQEYHQPPQQHRTLPQQNVNVSPVQFQNFDMGELVQQKENIGIIMDVPLEVTVELGRTKKKIKEILEFSPGTVIELEKIAGEPIDVLVNGKFVAHGEVVVIDENFGIRITDIINTENLV